MTPGNRRRPGVIAASALVGGLLALAAPTLAQTPSVSPSAQVPTAESVTVVAPRVVRREVAGGPTRFSGSPVEVLSASRTVSFGDLDLTTQAGADEFRQRIMYGALAACDEIEAEYPSNIYVPVSSSHNCPDATARAGLATAEEVIAATRSHAR